MALKAAEKAAELEAAAVQKEERLSSMRGEIEMLGAKQETLRIRLDGLRDSEAYRRLRARRGSAWRAVSCQAAASSSRSHARKVPSTVTASRAPAAKKAAATANGVR